MIWTHLFGTVGHSYSGELIWTQLFRTQLFWSYFGHSYTGQSTWTRLFWI